MTRLTGEGEEQKTNAETIKKIVEGPEKQCLGTYGRLFYIHFKIRKRKEDIPVFPGETHGGKGPCSQCAVQMHHSLSSTIYRAKVWKHVDELFSFSFCTPGLHLVNVFAGCGIVMVGARDWMAGITLLKNECKKSNVKHLSFMSLQQAF